MIFHAVVQQSAGCRCSRRLAAESHVVADHKIVRDARVVFGKPDSGIVFPPCISGKELMHEHNPQEKRVLFNRSSQVRITLQCLASINHGLLESRSRKIYPFAGAGKFDNLRFCKRERRLGPVFPSSIASASVRREDFSQVNDTRLYIRSHGVQEKAFVFASDEDDRRSSAEKCTHDTFLKSMESNYGPKKIVDK
jgi:hypothetical protein